MLNKKTLFSEQYNKTFSTHFGNTQSVLGYIVLEDTQQ